MNAGSKYDMVLMDIIMPNLDGVSACHLIRQFDHTPIIAMTSNIRSDDISMYFQHGKQDVDRFFQRTQRLNPTGMNDVLPKPFTKEGLLNMLEKHLGHLKKMPDGMESTPHLGGPSISQGSTGHSLKDEKSPSQSPSLSSNWQSPGQFPGISPTGAAPSHPYMQSMHGAYSQEQSPVQYHPPQNALSGGPPRPMQHRRQISEIGVDDLGSNDPKRQRMYDQNMAMGQMGPTTMMIYEVSFGQ